MTRTLNNPPVTVAVLRRAKPGYEADFERVILGITKAAMTFEGHLGANIFHSINPTDSEYLIIFKFDCMTNLQRWEESEVRHKWLARAEGLTLGPPATRILTGMETWFTLPAQQAVSPPRYKMALVTWLAIFPLISGINLLFGPVLNQMPLSLRTLILTVVLISLMTYFIMPQMTRIFAWWLYSSNQLSRCRTNKQYKNKH
jgi:hypothetical protein